MKMRVKIWASRKVPGVAARPEASEPALMPTSAAKKTRRRPTRSATGTSTKAPSPPRRIAARNQPESPGAIARPSEICLSAALSNPMS